MIMIKVMMKVKMGMEVVKMKTMSRVNLWRKIINNIHLIFEYFNENKVVNKVRFINCVFLKSCVTWIKTWVIRTN